jgi:hypothetical protein
MKLTAYEADQISQITVSKFHPPNALAKIFRRIASRGVNLVERVLPNSLARAAIGRALSIVEHLAGKDDVKCRAHVLNVAELHRRQLEDCDYLEIQRGVMSQPFLTGEGIVI